MMSFSRRKLPSYPPHRQGVDLEINLAEGATLGIKKIYPLGAQELEKLHTYIKQNEREDWIQESFVDGWFPIMFVKKKDCKLRLCIGYWALNNVTKKDRYPLPVIREALDWLQDAKYFTKLDIKDAYHNIRIREGDELKTTFTSKLGTYEYRVMPFGLCNPPATFARWINRTFHWYIDQCCIVYLDDVLIYLKNKRQHEKDVKNIVEAIHWSGMQIKPGKCEFHTTETEYLGFIINQEGIKVQGIKIQAIWDWIKPTKLKEIKKVLGFCNFFWRFIQRFSVMARPLHNLTKKGKWWEWGKEENEGFNQIRTKLISAPVLIRSIQPSQ